MDALVEQLASGSLGRKALVFVRRVASVKELQPKLEERYDELLFKRLRASLPGLESELDRQFESIAKREAVRHDAMRRPSQTRRPTTSLPAIAPEAESERSGLESFFAWFFRGEGPGGVLSGAALAERFTSPRSALDVLRGQLRSVAARRQARRSARGARSRAQGASSRVGGQVEAGRPHTSRSRRPAASVASTSSSPINWPPSSCSSV